MTNSLHTRLLAAIAALALLIAACGGDDGADVRDIGSDGGSDSGSSSEPSSDGSSSGTASE